jgi:hypothetical protein
LVTQIWFGSYNRSQFTLPHWELHVPSSQAEIAGGKGRAADQLPLIAFPRPGGYSPRMAKKASGKGRADVPVGQDAKQRVPTTRQKPSALVDTRVIYCGDNLEQGKAAGEFSVNTPTPSRGEGNRKEFIAFGQPAW